MHADTGLSLHTSVSALAEQRGLETADRVVYVAASPAKPRKARTPKTPAWMLRSPAGGHGQPDSSQPPIKLAAGFTSDWSPSFERYITDGGREKWVWERLKETHPAAHQIHHANRELGYKLYEIADLLGVSLSTVKRRNVQAVGLMGQYRIEYYEWRRVERHAEAA